MRRFAFVTAAVFTLLGGCPAAACLPPSIQFDLGSARVHLNEPATRDSLDEIVRDFRAQRGGRIDLRGTTDQLGSREANLRLSRRRGEAVKAALIRRGIPPNAIYVVAGGEQQGEEGAVPEYRLVWMAVISPHETGCY